ncbi:MAG: peptidoglycan binding domain-containing protein [Veillonella sp.]
MAKVILHMDMKMICGHISTRFKVILRSCFKPQYKLDEVKGKTYLSELAKTIDTPGHDAYLTIENGQVVLHPAKEGKRIDIDATLKKLKDDLQASDSINSLSMVFTTQNTVKVSDADLKPLNTVLASYTTEYDPSNESRTHNIISI